MTFLPDTNTCISFLRQKTSRLIAHWQSTKVTDIVLCSGEFSRISALRLEDWEP
jgi:predicted nucleic acid-binding protein